MIKMSEEARAARNAYARSWYRKNKEHVRNYRKEQRKNNVEQYRAREQKYREENREYFNEKSKKWRKENPDKVMQHQINHFEKKAKELKKLEQYY